MKLLVILAGLLTLAVALPAEDATPVSDVATSKQLPPKAKATAQAGKGSAKGHEGESFYLEAWSHHEPINRTLFTACHEGAAIEALCVGKKTGKKVATGSLFTLSGTTKKDDSEGYLTWNLVSNSAAVKTNMQLTNDIGSNVALPLFFPDPSDQMVGFDADNKMYMTTSQNDMVTPPKGGKSRKLYRWYTCETLYSDYTYTTLAWVYGKSLPENPSCRMVEVSRKWSGKKA